MEPIRNQKLDFSIASYSGHDSMGPGLSLIILDYTLGFQKFVFFFVFSLNPILLHNIQKTHHTSQNTYVFAYFSHHKH